VFCFLREMMMMMMILIDICLDIYVGYCLIVCDLKVELSILVHGIDKIFHFFANLRRSPNFDEEIY